MLVIADVVNYCVSVNSKGVSKLQFNVFLRFEIINALYEYKYYLGLLGYLYVS